MRTPPDISAGKPFPVLYYNDLKNPKSKAFLQIIKRGYHFKAGVGRIVDRKVEYFFWLGSKRMRSVGWAMKLKTYDI
jgi:hypothetical protein